MLKFKKEILTSLVACSYNSCLIIGMIAIILYVSGLERVRKVPMISLISYLLINLVLKCMLK